MSGAIEETEGIVKPLMGFVIAHDFRHADRVRRWAVRIAQAERYPNQEEVEAAGLLHDIGLSKDAGRRHAEIGADLATAFLAKQGYFSADQIERIAYSIRYHSSLDGTGRACIGSW
jgi:HD superfamily phosphodiesterase